ncbi:DUF4168 domain-containing protein [Pararhizobium antarcticum]|uniref:DUF4168 domain-containing protein n=1 Tax=Pararhizobium antarcticum TaxID=1798805 RepID=A0A657LTP2_9HYPH|nr:DUF4168 domain-containing protein [Pararhizobium antarcticum]OJF96826.1 hypothetical protein AX760_02875 [Pararhizobium antarcticum]OJF99000.1 hypothetical protein AX761_12320 [Rhizobium sp. 58]
MTIRHMPIAALGAAVLSLVVIGAPAFAQQNTAPQAKPIEGQSSEGQSSEGRSSEGQSMEQAAPAAISDEKLQAFAVAYLQVDKVRQDYSAKIGAAKDSTSKQKLQNEANQQMIKAVETSPNMSVEDYKTVISAAQTDPVIAKKLQEKLQAPAAAP